MKSKSQPLWLLYLGAIIVVSFCCWSFLFRSVEVRSVEFRQGETVDAPIGMTVPLMTVPLLENLGEHHHPITTESPLAQRYFNQGLVLAYSFNHAESVRSFQAATEADPNCAMCHWGLAYALGPNINAAMEAGDVPTAYEAIQRAEALSDSVSEPEQAYIRAMAKRYTQEPVEDRGALDRAFAKAAGEVAKAYPADLDAQALYAEALMDTMSWDYWKENGEPRPETTEVLNTLEAVMAQNPDHAWALHLYIHAVEKQRPEMGIAAADRLGDLVPAAGHLVHMPGHIYIRVGRYHDAVVANQKAVLADLDYVTQCHAQGLYQVAYMPHNYHFLWFAALMDGDEKVAMDAAYKTATVDKAMLREPGMGALQHYLVTPLYTQLKFERWADILASPAPEDDLVYAKGVWHYARGMAYAATGQPEKATAALADLRAIARGDAIKDITIWNINNAVDVLNIAADVLDGEILAATGDIDEAIMHLTHAVSLEDALKYDEPATWSSPVRQMLGNVLLQVGRPAEAEKAYREDLAIYPENGWSLKGLAASQEAQHKMAGAQSSQRPSQRRMAG
ncbi:MAG: hypothetical protein AAGC93_21795 [Cyanobacteria bacterium P01_F01_bin.53]